MKQLNAKGNQWVSDARDTSLSHSGLSLMSDKSVSEGKTGAICSRQRSAEIKSGWAAVSPATELSLKYSVDNDHQDSLEYDYLEENKYTAVTVWINSGNS